MPTEMEFEASPDAVAGRVLLEAGLKHLTPADLDAFREAVRRCYASAAQDDAAPDASPAAEQTA